MIDCIFCRIIEGLQPASIVHEDDLCIAFLDIRPINPGHTLVVPRRHAADLAELDVPSGDRLFAVARQIALALRSGILDAVGERCEGVNLLLSDGGAAGQVVNHLHMHVIPRFRGDGSGFRRSAVGRPAPPRQRLDAVASAIAGGLDALRQG